MVNCYLLSFANALNQSIPLRSQRNNDQRHAIPYPGVVNILNSLGANISMERMKEECYGNDFVLDNLHIRKYFQALISADDVHHSKPDPETYLKCAEELGVDPKNCIVFEDAPKGVESALNAGMKCVVLTILHGQNEFVTDQKVIGFVEDFNDPLLHKLLK